MKQLFIYLIIITCILACKPKTETDKDDTQPILPADAVQVMEKAIEEYPDSVKLYEKIIDTLANRRQFQLAASWCNKLLGRGADSNYFYWFVKGDIYRRGQLYDSAISSYHTYLNKFPDDEQVLLNLANTYAEAGNKNAVDLANKIATRFPNREMRSEAAFIKGVYYNQVQQFSEARRWLDTAIVINYTLSEAYMEKGYSFFDEQKYSDAFKTFKTLTNINSGYADAWYWMAKCDEEMGRTQEAISNYEQAYALDHSLVEALHAVDSLRSKPVSTPH
jgi:tetratricopeptide (TPR) repeat protein